MFDRRLGFSKEGKRKRSVRLLGFKRNSSQEMYDQGRAVTARETLFHLMKVRMATRARRRRNRASSLNVSN